MHFKKDRADTEVYGICVTSGEIRRGDDACRYGRFKDGVKDVCNNCELLKRRYEGHG